MTTTWVYIGSVCLGEPFETDILLRISLCKSTLPQIPEFAYHRISTGPKIYENVLKAGDRCGTYTGNFLWEGSRIE